MSAPFAGGMVTIYAGLTGPVAAGHRVRIVLAGRVENSDQEPADACRTIERAVAGRLFAGGSFSEFVKTVSERETPGGPFYVEFSIDGKLAEGWGDAEQLRVAAAHYAAFSVDEGDPFDFYQDDDTAGTWLTDLDRKEQEFANQWADFSDGGAHLTDAQRKKLGVKTTGEIIGETLHDEIAGVGGFARDAVTTVASAAGGAAGGLLKGLFGIPVWLLVVIIVVVLAAVAFAYFKFTAGGVL